MLRLERECKDEGDTLMSYESTIKSLIAEGNGYLRTADAVAKGISRVTLCAYVKKLNLEKVSHGVYVSPDVMTDGLFTLQLRNTEIVFSHETALYLHGLMDREPFITHVTVPTGYNGTHLRKAGICVHQRKSDLFDLGKTQVATHYGNMVNVYDMERTICDIVQNKGKMDIQVFQTALKEYIGSSKKNIPALMRYAKELKVEKVIRQYIEVLL